MARGQLRVYLGAAPGVGKTYKMLEEGHRRRERGTDVVVGFVETHGRPHTEAHARRPGGGAPPDDRPTAGPTFTEMDVDAVLRPRAPRWCWSTSWPTPTSPARRNAKRWQDIEELLDAGITVLTTVNIQHLESLNDVVAADHRRAAARDRARRGRPPGRAGRAGRHDPGGAAPADGARQHLPAPRRSTPRSATTSGSATSPRCASWPCSGWPTRSTTSSTATAPTTASPAPGRPANGSSSRSPAAPRATP